MSGNRFTTGRVSYEARCFVGIFVDKESNPGKLISKEVVFTDREQLLK
jgi:hypothetical protein